MHALSHFWPRDVISSGVLWLSRHVSDEPTFLRREDQRRRSGTMQALARAERDRLHTMTSVERMIACEPAGVCAPSLRRNARMPTQPPADPLLDLARLVVREADAVLARLQSP